MRLLAKHTGLLWRADRKPDCLIADSVSDGPVSTEKRYQLTPQTAPKPASKLRSLRSNLWLRKTFMCYFEKCMRALGK